MTETIEPMTQPPIDQQFAQEWLTALGLGCECGGQGGDGKNGAANHTEGL